MILTIGVLGYDNIETPYGKVERVLGGAANYFSIAASFFSPVSLVGVIGDDYEDKDLKLLENRNINLEGIESKEGKTFRWFSAYSNNLNEVKTLKVSLNVFENYKPKILEKHRSLPFVFISNLSPEVQFFITKQLSQHNFVALDTMGYWLEQPDKREIFRTLIHKVNGLILNEEEIKILLEEHNTIKAIENLHDLGLKTVVVKRGEYGFILSHHNQIFAHPAFPLSSVKDPTGAGDSFAGGFMGTLSRISQTSPEKEVSFNDLKQACLYGAVISSFTVEDFGIQKLLQISKNDIKQRMKCYIEKTEYFMESFNESLLV